MKAQNGEEVRLRNRRGKRGIGKTLLRFESEREVRRSVKLQSRLQTREGERGKHKGD